MSSLASLRVERASSTRGSSSEATLRALAERPVSSPLQSHATAMSALHRRQLVSSEHEALQRRFSRTVHRHEVMFSMLERREYKSFLATPLSAVTEIEHDLPPSQPAHTAFTAMRQHDTTPVVRDEQGIVIKWPWEDAPPGGTNDSPQHVPQTVNVFDVARSGAYDEMINSALDAASSDGRRGWNKTGTRGWRSFCADKGISPHRPMEPWAPLMLKLGEEWLCMEFICSLVEKRGVAVETARGYFSQTQGWHAREHGIKLCGGLKLERLPQMLKGLRRKLGDQGHKRPQRRAISPRQLQEALDHFYDPTVPLHANIRAAITCAYAGLMRSAEYCGTTGRNMLLRSDVVHFVPRREMVMMMHPCKNMHHLEGKTCPLLLGAGGTYIDPVAEYGNLREVDRISVADLGMTPLFRHPATNAPLSYDLINAACKQIGVWLGFQAEECTSHILRISGATAIFAAGGSELMIRTMGRWSSDLHRLYVRCCFEQCRDWSVKLGSVDFTATVDAFDEVDDY